MGAQQAQTETLEAIVNELEAGDEFQIHAWECKVDEVVDIEGRPYLTVSKKSVGGWMATDYRLEWADPTNEDDETLVIKADRKHGWDVKFTFAPEEVEY